MVTDVVYIDYTLEVQGKIPRSLTPPLLQKERTMQSPENKVDMAQMNAAIDKVLALPAAPKAKQKNRRVQRKARQSALVNEPKAPYKADKR